MHEIENEVVWFVILKIHIHELVIFKTDEVFLSNNQCSDEQSEIISTNDLMGPFSLKWICLGVVDHHIQTILNVRRDK